MMLYTTCQLRDFLLVFSCSGMLEMENEKDSLSNEVCKNVKKLSDYASHNNSYCRQ